MPRLRSSSPMISRKAGVNRKLATRAAAHIAEPGEWLQDILDGARALIAGRYGTRMPKRIPAKVLLGISVSPEQKEPIIFIGPLKEITADLAEGDRFAAVSATAAMATVIERAAKAKIDLDPYLLPLKKKQKRKAN